MATQSPPGLSLLRPAVALVGWTFVMEAWMYKTRIAFIESNKKTFKIGPESSVADMNRQIPASIRWKGI